MQSFMIHMLTGFLALTLCFSSAFAETPAPIEIRFCPPSAVHTYPLESRRDLQSLMLQNVAVINHGEAPFKIDHIEIELLQSGEVLDSKKLNVLPSVERRCRKRACSNRSPSNFAGTT